MLTPPPLPKIKSHYNSFTSKTISMPRTYPVMNSRVKEIINYSKTYHGVINEEPIEVQEINDLFGSLDGLVNFILWLHDLIDEKLFDYIIHFEFTHDELRYLRYLDEN